MSGFGYGRGHVKMSRIHVFPVILLNFLLSKRIKCEKTSGNHTKKWLSAQDAKYALFLRFGVTPL